jgi:cytochrome c oxidase subunit IV
MAQEQGHEPSTGTYFKVWGLLFVLSTASYFANYFFQGYVRWSLIILLMLVQAGLIVAVLMHLVWERVALMFVILVPPLFLLTLLSIGALEADYTFSTRDAFFGPASQPTAEHK